MEPLPTAIAGQGRAELARRLELAQAAFEEYKTRCFWHLRDDFEVTPENLSAVIRGLRNEGDRHAFQIAARLCR